MRILLNVALVVLCGTCCSAFMPVEQGYLPPPEVLKSQNKRLLATAELANTVEDIEEDQDDPFVTTGSGKPRPVFLASDEANQWMEDVPRTVGKVLSRRKRCGRRDDDDDGDANRARRARRARKKAARKARRKAAKSRTTQTVVTRKVIQNGQVVSQSQSVEGQVVQASQPVVVQSVLPQQATVSTPAVAVSSAQVVV